MIHRIGLAASALLFMFPAQAGAAAGGLPPAAHEDSCGPGVSRCVWDARHRGNGHGRSFIIRRDGDIRYVTHRRAHRLVAAWRQAHRADQGIGGVGR